MSAYIFVGVASVLFLVGLVFILRGVFSAPSEDSAAVPISDLKELKEFKDVYASDKPSNPANQKPAPISSTPKVSLTRHLIKETIAQSSTTREAKEPVVSNVKNDLPRADDIVLEDLKKENKRLKDALDREISNRDVAAIDQESQKMLSHLEVKIKQADESIQRLSNENHKIKNEIQGVKKENIQLKDSLDKAASERDLLKQVDTSKESELNSQIIQKRKEQETNEQLNKMIDELKAIDQKNKDIIKQLEGQLDEIRTDNKGLRGQLVDASKDLRAENERLVETIENRNLRIKELEGAVEYVKNENDKKIDEAYDIINAIGVSEGLASNEKTQELRMMLDDLKREKNELKMDRDNLELSLRKTNEINSVLLEKERKLHYELTKNRAQAIGFEKICEDFKSQINEMS